MFRNICLSPYKSCKVLEDILQLKTILINLWLIVAVIHRHLKLSHVISEFTFPSVIGATENKKKNLGSQWELSEFSDFFLYFLLVHLPVCVLSVHTRSYIHVLTWYNFPVCSESQFLCCTQPLCISNFLRQKRDSFF